MWYTLGLFVCILLARVCAGIGNVFYARSDGAVGQTKEQTEYKRAKIADSVGQAVLCVGIILMAYYLGDMFFDWAVAQPVNPHYHTPDNVNLIPLGY